MNLGIFTSQTDFQKQLSELKAYLENSIEGLLTLQQALATRSQLEKDYQKGCATLLEDLKQKTLKMKNQALRQSIEYIWRDWEASAEQSAKLGNELGHMAEKEIAPFAERYRVRIKRWFQSLHGTEGRALGSCEMYKEAQADYKAKGAELGLIMKREIAKQIKPAIKKKEKAERRLMALGRQVLLEKEKIELLVRSIQNDVRKKESELGRFANDLVMKNFIWQVNQMKSREYDVDQIIKDFRGANQGVYDFEEDQSRQKKNSTDLNLTNKNNSENQKSEVANPKFDRNRKDSEKVEIPVELAIPQKKFFQVLETQFYQNIHSDLLKRQSILRPGMPSFSSLSSECVALSKLMDGLNLHIFEQKLLSALPQKDPKGIFLTEVLKSFLRYKKYKVAIEESRASFLSRDLLAPILRDSISENNFEHSWRLIEQIQRLSISTLEAAKPRPISQSMIFPQENINQRKISFNEMESIPRSNTVNWNFKIWARNRPIGLVLRQILEKKRFWVAGFSEMTMREDRRQGSFSKSFSSRGTRRSDQLQNDMGASFVSRDLKSKISMERSGLRAKIVNQTSSEVVAGDGKISVKGVESQNLESGVANQGFFSGFNFSRNYFSKSILGRGGETKEIVEDAGNSGKLGAEEKNNGGAISDANKNKSDDSNHKNNPKKIEKEDLKKSEVDFLKTPKPNALNFKNPFSDEISDAETESLKCPTEKFKQVILKNLISCRSHIKNQKDFSEILVIVDSEFEGWNLLEAWETHWKQFEKPLQRNFQTDEGHSLAKSQNFDVFRKNIKDLEKKDLLPDFGNQESKNKNQKVDSFPKSSKVTVNKKFDLGNESFLAQSYFGGLGLYIYDIRDLKEPSKPVQGKKTRVTIF